MTEATTPTLSPTPLFKQSQQTFRSVNKWQVRTLSPPGQPLIKTIKTSNQQSVFVRVYS